MIVWQHWIVGQIDASIAAGIVLILTVRLRHRLPPGVRSVLLLVALLRLALPPWLQAPWSEALVDLPPLDESRYQLAQLVRADVTMVAAILTSLVSIALLIRLAWQLRVARAWHLADTIEAPTAIRARVHQLAGPLTPDVRLSASGVGPMAVGIRRQTIVLPAAILELPPPALDAVLAHEAAHHRRRDLLWIVVGSMLASLVWFNPLARLIARELRSTREDGCDDWAVNHTSGDPCLYAHALLQSARLVAAGSPAGAVSAHPMGRRVRRLLDADACRDSRIGFAGLILILTVITLALPGASVPDADDRHDAPVVIVIRR